MNDLKYVDCDLYHVEMINGKKVVHIDGYCYKQDKEYKLVQFVGCYVEVCKAADLSEHAIQSAKQYQTDMQSKDVARYYKDAIELPYKKLTKETLCGWYVNYEKDKLKKHYELLAEKHGIKVGNRYRIDRLCEDNDRAIVGIDFEKGLVTLEKGFGIYDGYTETERWMMSMEGIVEYLKPNQAYQWIQVDKNRKDVKP